MEDVFKVKQEGTTLIVHLGMEVSVENSPALQKKLMEHQGQDIKKIVFDASDLLFISSSGVRVLVSAQQKIGHSPKMEMMPFIQAGVAQTHPEFKQEVIVPKEEDHFFQSDSSAYETERHLVCTMPEVDKERAAFLKETVKALYDQCMTEVNKVKGSCSDMLADKTKDLPKKEADEAKEEMEKMMDMYAKTIDIYRDNKVKEIEESHQKWIAQQVESRLEGLQNKNNNN